MLQLPKTRFSSFALVTILGGLSSTSAAHELFASDSPWMLGDWGGTRTELLEKGYDFTLGYTGEMGSNLHGGYDHDRTARYSDQFTFASHLDLEKVLGWHDAEFKLAITERHGQAPQKRQAARWQEERNLPGGPDRVIGEGVTEG